MTVQVITGDCRDVLASLPAESVHCCVTSPPYYGLRDYGVDGQIGLEETPDAFVSRLVEVFREVRRVLRDDGTFWLNIGDSYAASQTTNGGYSAKSTLAGFTNPNTKGRQANDALKPRRLAHGAKPKDLLGIPWLLAFALRADGWYLRKDIIWHKPNPMPESVTDRPTSAHEHVFLLAKSERYFFDAEAVKENCESGPSDIRKMVEGRERIGGKHKSLDDHLSKASALTNIGRRRSVGSPNGRNIRDVWTIATQPFSDAHFATFPPALVEPCIKAGSSERGCCPGCGAPWQRIVEKPDFSQQPKRATCRSEGEQLSHGAGYLTSAGQKWQEWRDANPNRTVGWAPSCACPAHDPIPCTVLDPFFGAGTTGLVADRLGRNCIGIELNPGYADMARRRIQADAPLLAEVG